MTKIIIDKSQIKINLNIIPLNLFYFSCTTDNLKNIFYNSEMLDVNFQKIINDYPNIFFENFY